jgi:predicted mannosyl-3-phosphoglycerate phosphatase (HAD superfamily)
MPVSALFRAPCAPWPPPPAALARVCGIFTDIDDTLTADGRLDPPAAAALADLHAAGVPVVAITGRPQGWSEAFALDWPVMAIVAENGAVALIPQAGRLVVEYTQDAATRDHNTTRLRAAAEHVQRPCHRHRHRPQRVQSPR